MTMKIESFTGRYRFLSNSFPAPVTLSGVEYPTAEHAYQAMKTDDKGERTEILRQKTPGAAKRAGRKVTLREGWDISKIGVMEEILRLKFADPELRDELLATGHMELIEGNDWGDRFWGVYLGGGQNELGKALMRVRADIMAEPKKHRGKTMTIKDRPGFRPAQEIRDHFEKAVQNTAILKDNTPLGAMKINDEFDHYMNPDTDTLWIGFALGMRCAERLEKAGQ